MMNGAVMGKQAQQPPPPAKPGGIEDLAQYLDSSKSECLNEADDHPYQHCLTSGGGHLASDCDEQLIISLSFNQVVKVQSLRIKAPANCGPKTIRVFKNLPNTLDFTGAETMTSSGYCSDNQTAGWRGSDPSQVCQVPECPGGEDVTQIDHLMLLGMPLQTTNMKDLKKA